MSPKILGKHGWGGAVEKTGTVPFLPTTLYVESRIVVERAGEHGQG
jgi:hypothetical protein